MKAYVVSAAVSLASVALALAFFFAGFFVRGYVDQARGLAAPAPAGQTGQAGKPVQTVAQPAAAPTPAPQANATYVGNVNVDGLPARGPENALVTVVEFSDFQCPFCKSYFDNTYPLVTSAYGDKVRYVFRDFPIEQLHPQAPKAAEAGRCAFEQGKFWQYHDSLFQNQGRLDAVGLKAQARDVGLDGAAFDRCLESGKYTEAVKKAFDEGMGLGVTGTPTFVINGQKVVGAQPFSALKAVIDAELAKAGAR